MQELHEVSNDRIQALLGVMESTGATQPSGKAIQRTIDEDIKTRLQLVAGLKQGMIPGNAIVEWSDEQGSLQVNVIDFLVYGKIKALDPKSGDRIVVESKKIPDGAWRVAY